MRAMKRKNKVACFLRFLLVLATLLSLQACGGTGVTSINIGGGTNPPPPPPFTDFNAPGAGQRIDGGTFPLAINSSGIIVGWYYDVSGIVHGFTRTSDGTYSVIDAPGATTTVCCLGTFAEDINTSGSVTGYFNDSNLGSHGFIRAADGSYTTIDAAGYSGVAWTSINDSGVVIGSALGNNQSRTAFIRATDGTMTFFDVPNASQTGIGTVPVKINSQGLVVGYFYDVGGSVRGFMRAVDGTITILDAPGDAPPCSNCLTQPAGINASGQITGVTYDGTLTQFFLRDSDGTYTVFSPPNAISSGSETGLLAVSGINDAGEIVGSYPDSTFVSHGFIRGTDGNFIVLDAGSAGSQGEYGTVATGIDSSGAAVGSYSEAPSFSGGFVWK
jgi:hypothetical protein